MGNKSFREKAEDVVGSACHFLAGLLTAFFVLVHPVLSLLGFAGFWIYEIIQWKVKGDPPLAEGRTFLFGYFLGGLLLKILIVGAPYY